MEKAFCLNENYLFPTCNQCDSELTPYSVTTEFLNKRIQFTQLLIKCDLIRINAIDIDIHVIFLCTKCIHNKEKQ